MIQPRVLLLLALGLSGPVQADEPLTIAVASNFRGTAEKIAVAFTSEFKTPVRLSSGSTGKLYAQIVNGAPYDIFLAADTERPRLLEATGVALDDSLMAYANGKLALISADPALKGQSCLGVLTSGSYRRIAIANPQTAPYGAAAKAWLMAEGVWEEALPRMIMGESISQTFQFVATGNATLGIVAISQLTGTDTPVNITCRWAIDIPEDAAVRQAGVILSRTDNLDAARSFMKFLRSETAKSLISSYGYGVPAS